MDMSLNTKYNLGSDEHFWSKITFYLGTYSRIKIISLNKIIILLGFVRNIINLIGTYNYVSLN